MILRTSSAGSGNYVSTISIQCPGCGQMGTFDRIGEVRDVQAILPEGKQAHFGFRKCPNQTCGAVVAFLWRDGKLADTYPPQRIDFDSTSIPISILKVLQEAIDCHAHGSYTASAMMVRKSLEVLCAEQGAKGKNLKDRLQALKGKLLIPSELLDGMDELRLFGNDATHIEAHLYDDIVKEEVEVAIEITKEILKAVYQYSSLLNKLRSLKKPPTT